MQEYEKNVLEKYKVELLSTRKVRGAVLCDTRQGLFLLKEAKAPEARILALNQLYQSLEEQGYPSVDALVANEEGAYITEAEDKRKFVLRKWFPARECDLKKTAELLEASRNLAKLHGFLHMELSGNVEAESLDQEYERHNRELRKVRSFIRSTTSKGEFETLFLKNYDEIYQWTRIAEDVLQKSGYEKLRKQCKEENSLVHGEYNYHNILMKAEERGKSVNLVATVNFDKFKQDVQVEDLYYFLRKVMEKHGWKERLGDGMLNAYSAIRPLSKEEVEYLKVRFLYPEKFWKIANTYYHSKKAWIPSKNVEKLATEIRQLKEKERFVEQIFSVRL